MIRVFMMEASEFIYISDLPPQILSEMPDTNVFRVIESPSERLLEIEKEHLRPGWKAIGGIYTNDVGWFCQKVYWPL